jgi:hypothetical protein
MKRYGLFLGVFFVLSACGGGSSGDPKSAAMFVGTWTASAQTGQTVTCGTQSVTIPLWGKVNVSLTAPNSGQVLTQADNGCTLTWSCNGNVATVLPGSSCQVQVPPNGNWQAAFTKGTLTLGSNEITLQDNGTAIYTVNSAAQSCVFEQSGSFSDSAN